MVRLTADLILVSAQYFNAVKERELDLRGNKIAVIENLGATEDLFDSIDLSDNEIVKLEGFPVLPRLSTLLMNNNRVARISPSIARCLPNLQTLVLTNNRLVELSELDALSALPKLLHLSLIDNAVTRKQGYRLYTVHCLPKLRTLDFRKVKVKERQEATRLYGPPPGTARKGGVKTGGGGSGGVRSAGSSRGEEGQKVGQAGRQGTAGGGLPAVRNLRDTAQRSGEDEMVVSGGEGDGREGMEGGEREGEERKRGRETGEESGREGGEEARQDAKRNRAPTPDELTAIKAAIATARTLEEVAQLEEVLKSGQIPTDMKLLSSSASQPTAMQEGL